VLKHFLHHFILSNFSHRCFHGKYDDDYDDDDDCKTKFTVHAIQQILRALGMFNNHEFDLKTLQ